MCDSNVMHRVAILTSHNTVELSLVHQKVWRFRSSGMWCCVAGWVISSAHGTHLPSSTALKSPKTSSAAALLWVWLDESQYLLLQHANEDVEKMILGNKNDMDEKRVVSRERGEAVSIVTEGVVSGKGGGGQQWVLWQWIHTGNSFTVRLCRLNDCYIRSLLTLHPYCL